MSRTGADDVRDAVLDRGSFLSWDAAALTVPVSDSYAAELAAARAATGRDEAVLTGEGRINGRRVAVIASDFDFLAGSIGVAAAERITAAIQRATAERLPLLASPSSGGTRMQEGTVAFLQMVKIAAAVELHKRAHLPYLVYLRHPTTGGVFASWGSLGHITLSEPGALLGFLGPRVYEQLYGAPFPPGVQTAENLQAYGVIDGVIPLKWLRRTCARALKVMLDEPGPAPAKPRRSRSPTSRRGTPCAPRDGPIGRVSGFCCGTVPPSACSWRAPAAPIAAPRSCWRWHASAGSPPWCWGSCGAQIS